VVELCGTCCLMEGTLYSCYRITEWPGLEGTSMIMNLQPPCQAGPPTSPFTRPGCPGPHPTWPLEAYNILFTHLCNFEHFLPLVRCDWSILGFVKGKLSVFAVSVFGLYWFR